MRTSLRQRRDERKRRSQSLVDMNLVSLIDVFTLLIFFLLSNSSGMDNLLETNLVKIPESTADHLPPAALIVTVSAREILVNGRRATLMGDATNGDEELIDRLKTELEQQPNHSKLVIVGDQQIPYQLLKKVMQTCASANFTDISFAVRHGADR